MHKNNLDLCPWCMSALVGDSCSSANCVGKSQQVHDRPNTLPAHSLLENRYLVGAVVSSLPDGFVYAAYDTEEEEKLWLYEFFNPTLGVRTAGVVAPKQKKEIEYKTLLAFVESAYRKLTHLSFKDCFAPVRRVFRENGTVYAAMHMTEGRSFNRYLGDVGGELDWNSFKKSFMPLCSTVSRLAREDVLVSPLLEENLLVTADGKFYLRALSFVNQCGFERDNLKSFAALTAPEFYQKNTFITPSADIYTLAALAYRALTGTMPPDAPSRAVVDNLRAPAELQNQIPAPVSAAIMAALSVEVEGRPHNIEAFTAALLEDVSSNTAVFTADDPVKPFTVGAKEVPAPTEDKKRAKWPIVLVALLLAAVGTFFIYNTFFKGGSTPPDPDVEPLVLAPLPPARYVPSLEGRYLTSVDNSDYNEQFNFSIRRTFSDSYPEGVIISQLPRAGVKMLHKGTIIITVSVGSQVIAMPNLAGSSVDFAVQILTEKKITYRIEATDESTNPNIVFKTSVTAGEEFDRSSTTVTLYVGKTPSSSSTQSAPSSSSDSSEDSSSQASSTSSSTWTSASEIEGNETHR